MKKSELKQLIREVVEELKEEWSRVSEEFNRRLDGLNDQQKRDNGIVISMISDFVDELKREGSYNVRAANDLRQSLRTHQIDSWLFDDAMESSGINDDVDI